MPKHIQVRVVRIDDSPFAPIFEVIEKPNDWERAMARKTSTEGAAHYEVRKQFWTECVARHPELASSGFRAWRYANNYVELHDVPRIEHSVFIGKHQSGAFVRCEHSAPFEPVLDLLEPHAEGLAVRLGVPFGPLGKRDHCLMRTIGKGQEQTEAWPEIMDWMRDAVSDYRVAFNEILAEPD